MQDLNCNFSVQQKILPSYHLQLNRIPFFILFFASVLTIIIILISNERIYYPTQMTHFLFWVFILICFFIFFQILINNNPKMPITLMLTAIVNSPRINSNDSSILTNFKTVSNSKLNILIFFLRIYILISFEEKCNTFTIFSCILTLLPYLL